MIKPQVQLSDLFKIHDALYEIPKSFRNDMRVPALIFANEEMFADIKDDASLTQMVNVATLPGIVKHALAMPDIHQGYGFPIGGVAAFDIDNGGIISPGGIGYDINCGVRLLAVDVKGSEIRKHLDRLATDIFNNVPSGVGRGGRLKLGKQELDKVLIKGAKQMLELGYGTESDLEFCEENGEMEEANPIKVSEKAKSRGSDQLGTLGSGNHFLEIQEVDEIYDEKIAQVFGLQKGTITIMIHCGSRGLGHQVCTDYVRLMVANLERWKINLPDRELACAPFSSKEAHDYYSAMCAAANFAWANRHVIAHWVRKSVHKIIGDVNIRLIYDLSHNMGKKEKHKIDGKNLNLIVHRKGATRAFPAGRPEIPEKYRETGHPVLIPGTMGTSSYVLVGTQQGLETAFGSSCHGAGRRLSRIKAKSVVKGSTLRQELENQGIIIRCESDIGLAEEAPIAYKDVDNVVKVVEDAGLARRVVRVVPLAVVKGG